MTLFYCYPFVSVVIYWFNYALIKLSLSTCDPLTYRSCCGLEWLINDNSQAFWFPHSITCVLNNTVHFIEDFYGTRYLLHECNFAGQSICPCLNVSLIEFMPSLDACINASSVHLLGDVCYHISECPSGYRETPIFASSTSPGTTCVYTNTSHNSNITVFLVETKCEGLLPSMLILFQI